MNLKLRAWVLFLRLPNGLTVPGDVWAGAVLAGLAPFSSPWIAVCAAYVFGMALNDLIDLPRDREERPERPLPSGKVPLPRARLVCAGLGVLAFALHPSPAMAVLLGAVGAYNLLKERCRPAGPLLMAGCRMAAVWIGAGGGVPPSPSVGLAMAGWGGFILGVTALARLETTARRPGRLPLFPAGWLCMAPLAVWSLSPPAGWPAAAALQAVLVVSAAAAARRIQRRGAVAPADIGRFLRLLFPLQAAVLAGGGTWLAAGLVLAGWPLLAWISRRFPMS